MARQTKPPQSGAERSGSAPGKRKIGGDLQGEPIFRLSGPAAALQVPNPRPCSRTDTSENLGRLLFPITNLLERFPEPALPHGQGPTYRRSFSWAPLTLARIFTSLLQSLECAPSALHPNQSGEVDRQSGGSTSVPKSWSARNSCRDIER
jgi:hypothetical protein